MDREDDAVWRDSGPWQYISIHSTDNLVKMIYGKTPENFGNNATGALQLIWLGAEDDETHVKSIIREGATQILLFSRRLVNLYFDTLIQRVRAAIKEERSVGSQGESTHSHFCKQREDLSRHSKVGEPVLIIVPMSASHKGMKCHVRKSTEFY